MQQILSLIRVLVDGPDHARLIVMAVVHLFPARALLQLGKELIAMAESLLVEESYVEPESIPVVVRAGETPIDLGTEPLRLETVAPASVDPPAGESPAGEPSPPAETPAAKPARKPRKAAAKAAE
ncbi:hypothetical protein [Schlesneria sp. DSM 10557]|uniref:hypothetical protein n=1 Tax=Schlesneria sp. DSM 10557 TaxID=3044399 RepID=UPI0035A1CAA8